MKLILKIIALPIVLVLTLLTWICFGIVHCTAWVFGLASALLVILGVFSFFTVTHQNGIILLVLAFLVSPVGLPKLAVHIVGGLHSINNSLKQFIQS